MKYIFILMLILSNFLFICGCITQNSAIVEKNYTQFAEEINTSQSYYDQMVSADPLNATAWCIRGNYYNNVFNQYDKALESYNRALELDPHNGYCWYSKGITLQNMMQFNESKICFNNAKQTDPTLSVR